MILYSVTRFFFVVMATVRFVAGQVPPNDACPDSITVVPSMHATPVATGNTADATSFSFPQCDTIGISDSPRVFFNFVGTGARMRVSTCGPQTTFATRVIVDVTGGSCDNPDVFCGSPAYNAFYDCPAPNDGNAAYSEVYTVPDQTYLVAVQGYWGGQTGGFALSVLEYLLPSNDKCEDATLITPSNTLQPVVTGSTMNATFHRFSDCAETGISDSHAVFYQFVGTGARMRVSTCAPQTNIATRLVVDIMGRACDHDIVFCGAPRFTSDYDCPSPSGGDAVYTEIYTVENQTYLIAVQSYWGGQSGNFGLVLLEYILPDNDKCLDATEITPTNTLAPVVVGSTANATFHQFPDCSDTGIRDAPTVFYKFIGTGSRMRVSTCAPQTNFATRLLIDNMGRDCDDELVFCGVQRTNTDNSCPSPSNGDAVFTEFFTVENQVYYVAVQAYWGAQSGRFGLSLLEYIPPENDKCSEALLIEPSESTDPVAIGSLANATLGTGFQNCPAVGLGDAPTVYYKLVGTGTLVRLSTCTAVTTQLVEIFVDINGRECDDADLFCGMTRSTFTECSVANFGVAVEFPTVKDQIYMIAVQGTLGQGMGGRFGLTFQEAASSPPSAPVGIPPVIPVPPTPTSSSLFDKTMFWTVAFAVWILWMLV